MSSNYFDKGDHAIYAINYYDTLIKIDRVKAVLNKLKRDLRHYESAIREIEYRNDKLPKDRYIFRKNL